MSSIHSLIDYDLCISTSWSNPDIKDAPEHGISGHTFEMIEYFWYIRKYINCCLLWTETMDNKTLKNILETKYNFDDNEINIILSHSVFIYKPKLLRVNNILMVDGNINKNNLLIYKHLFIFSCGNKNNHLILDEKITILQDYRIYDQGPRTLDYTKKILFNRLNWVKEPDKTSLLYLTTNCRFFDIIEVRECINYYDNVFKLIPGRKWLIATNNTKLYKELENEYNLEVVELPIENFQNKFDHFVYTPLIRKFDCSNRLLAECKYFNKMTNMYNIDYEYLKEDVGLQTRLDDINYLERIDLNQANRDVIINILRDRMIK